MQGKTGATKPETLTEKLKKKNAAARLGIFARVLRETLWLGAGFLFGQASLLFETNPLGVAFLCAASGHILPISTGLILSAWWIGGQPWLLTVTYLAAALIRAISSRLAEPHEKIRQPLPEQIRAKLYPEKEGAGLPADKPEKSGSRLRERLEKLFVLPFFREFGREFKELFHEWIPLRMATAAVCMLIVALFRVIAGGFSYYDLFAALFSVAVAPAAVMVYTSFLGERKQFRILYAISAAALLFSLIWSADSLVLGTVPLSACFALFFSLLIAHRVGLPAGIASAVLCGLAHDPMAIPAYLLAVLFYAVFRARGRELFGVPCAVFAALGWSVYAHGVRALLPLLFADLAAGAAFTLVVRLTDLGKSKEKAEDPLPDHEAAMQFRVLSKHQNETTDRLRGISEAFSSLSEMFYNLSDRLRRPTTIDLRRLCDNSFDRFCTDCPHRTVCWGLEYADSLEVLNALAKSLHTHGTVTQKQISPVLLRRCGSMDQILSEINRDCARLTGELLRDNRTEIFAMDYEAAANIINDALEEDEQEYRLDTEIAGRIAEYLPSAGLSAQAVVVYGGRLRQVAIRDMNIDRASVSAETLRRDISELCRAELSTPSFEVEGPVCTMVLHTRRRFFVVGAQKCVSANGGVCGDAVTLFSNRKDYFYALINDGMGSGRDAALTANLCSVFLEKMLRAGNRTNTSLRMLNNLLLSRTHENSAAECSSTVDLLELDLVSGAGTFIKSGAAPSFVVRGATVHRVQTGSAPIGILRETEAQSSEFSFRAGDTVVLVSDGILQEDADAVWLTNYLCGIEEINPEKIAYQICAHAAKAERRDDCSAIVLRIEENEE